MNRKKNNKIVNTQMARSSILERFYFGVIFVYMIICLVMYVTTDHITAYEVTAGPLARNYRYNALALRTETIVTADQCRQCQLLCQRRKQSRKWNGSLLGE
ncbi:MAG: hypothetical protein V8S22_09320 [Lachnospiraceae bacterium]